VQICAGSSGDLPPPSPPGEKATTSKDQAGQASTDDGAGDGKYGGEVLKFLFLIECVSVPDLSFLI